MHLQTMNPTLRAARVLATIASGLVACGSTQSEATVHDASTSSEAAMSAPSGVDPCTTDNDCVIATDETQCCPKCPGAYSKQELARDSCLSVDGQTVPANCTLPSCATMACSNIACSIPTRAVCTAGKCVPTMDCAPGSVHVQDPYGVITQCHAACATNTDCAIALHAMPCCPQSLCPTAWPADLVSNAACLIPPADPIPASCGTSPSCNTAGGPCPVMDCPTTHAVCLDSGDCTAVPEGETCPAGYLDTGTQCVARDVGADANPG